MVFHRLMSAFTREGAIFSTIDANRGYSQIETEESGGDKSAFTCFPGLYRFTDIPFGLRNASGILQRTMDYILATLKWQ